MPSAKRERKREGRAARQEAIRAAQRRRARQRQFLILAVLVVAVFAIGIFAFRDKGGKGTENLSASDAKKAAPCPKATGEAKRAKFDAPQRMCISKTKTYIATVSTDVGDFAITLEPKTTPITTNNFVVLARYHFFDGAPFHRVIPDFVVQGGDPTGTGTGDPGYKFNDENLEKTTYGPGDIAMANSGPNTNGSQFFVILSENGAKTLVGAAGGAPKYSKFGKVTSGMDVLKKIETDGGTSQGNGTDLKVKHHIVKVTIEER